MRAPTGRAGKISGRTPSPQGFELRSSRPDSGKKSFKERLTGQIFGADDEGERRTNPRSTISQPAPTKTRKSKRDFVLTATLIRRFAPPSPRGRRTILKTILLPLGEGGAKRRMRVAGLPPSFPTFP